MIQIAEVKKKVEHANEVLNSLYGSPRRALAHRLVCQGWNGEDHMLNIVSVSRAQIASKRNEFKLSYVAI